MLVENPGVPGYTRSQVVLQSADYKGDQAVTLTNLANRALHVILDVTAKTSTPTSIMLSIKGIDPASGKKYSLLDGEAVTGVATKVYKVFPSAVAELNAVANDMLPPLVEISVVGVGVTDTKYFTFSVGANWGT